MNLDIYKLTHVYLLNSFISPSFNTSLRPKNLPNFCAFKQIVYSCVYPPEKYLANVSEIQLVSYCIYETLSYYTILYYTIRSSMPCKSNLTTWSYFIIVNSFIFFSLINPLLLDRERWRWQHLSNVLVYLLSYFFQYIREWNTTFWCLWLFWLFGRINRFIEGLVSGVILWNQWIL